MKKYIESKWKKVVVLGGLLLMLGTAGMIWIPYAMDRWSRDRQIGILHSISGAVLFLMAAAGIFLFYRKEALEHDRNWKKDLAELLAGYVMIQCIAGIITGAAGMLLYQLCHISYEHTKMALYLLNSLWQSLCRAGFIYLMTKRMHGKNWKLDWKEDRKCWRKKVLVIGAAALAPAGIPFFSDTFVWRVLMVFWAVGYLLLLILYDFYREAVKEEGKSEEI